ncbi:transporter hol1 [Fusarium mexicanum]|uniref:Transporter hol1 n=1 Tax=Fusarium mexicanum TaxID=751941 RepID=A0A8H5J7I7_9HYPO|nr:transporter hol1 [Fusarium mexicanum]
MAEALGTASAIITIWDLVGKAKKMHDQIKAAPGTWKLYCDGLESLAHVQAVVKDLVRTTPRMEIPVIDVREGESQNLVSFVNYNLETVRKQATNILDQHDLATNRSSRAKKFHRWLTHSFQQSLPPWIQALQIMSSAVTVGYLTLETQRHLPDAQEGGNPNFLGVSFEAAAEWIRSMMDLGDWMIRTVPPARRMPRLLADLAMFVPVLGVGLHESGISTGLSPHVHKDLTNLITRLKAEDWGIGLEKPASLEAWLHFPEAGSHSKALHEE